MEKGVERPVEFPLGVVEFPVEFPQGVVEFPVEFLPPKVEFPYAFNLKIALWYTLIGGSGEISGGFLSKYLNI